jgi:hypothetical protein
MRVRWQELLANHDAQAHVTSKRELDNMRALIQRDLKDSALSGLSADRRFATAYNAALQAANMAVACVGYRITAKTGHHRVTLEAAALAIGTSARAFTDYFEICRRKRNLIDYTYSHVASDSEASELLSKAQKFYEAVETWITAHHPALVK